MVTWKARRIVSSPKQTGISFIPACFMMLTFVPVVGKYFAEQIVEVLMSGSEWDIVCGKWSTSALFV
jgi:hypothetical protein